MERPRGTRRPAAPPVHEPPRRPFEMVGGCWVPSTKTFFLQNRQMGDDSFEPCETVGPIAPKTEREAMPVPDYQTWMQKTSAGAFAVRSSELKAIDQGLLAYHRAHTPYGKEWTANELRI